jgi:hypothetical protein
MIRGERKATFLLECIGTFLAFVWREERAFMLLLTLTLARVYTC